MARRARIRTMRLRRFAEQAEWFIRLTAHHQENENEQLVGQVSDLPRTSEICVTFSEEKSHNQHSGN